VLPLVGVVGSIDLAAASSVGDGISALERVLRTKAATLVDKHIAMIRAILNRTILETKCVCARLNMSASPFPTIVDPSSLRLPTTESRN